MSRSVEEVNKFNSSFAEWKEEINAGGVERYYECPSNNEILRRAMLNLQKELFADNPLAVWATRIWGSVYSQVVGKLKVRPVQSREERERLLHWKDRREGLKPRTLTPEQQEEDERDRRKKAEEEMFKKKAAALAHGQALEAEEKNAQDIEDNPHRHIPAELVKGDREATQEELIKMPRAVLKCWMQRRKSFLQDEANRVAQEKEAARIARKLTGV